MKQFWYTIFGVFCAVLAVLVVLGVLYFWVQIALANHYPSEVSFLNAETMQVISVGVCTQTTTGKQFRCEELFQMDTGNMFLVVWEGEGKVREVWRKDRTTGAVIKVYSATADCPEPCS